MVFTLTKRLFDIQVEINGQINMIDTDTNTVTKVILLCTKMNLFTFKSVENITGQNLTNQKLTEA